MSRASVGYCCFYGRDSAAFPGQRNLSDPVRHALGRRFRMVDAGAARHGGRFPGLGSVLLALHRILLARLWRRGGARRVTVVDLIHSFTALDRARRHDRLILLGHDSYALRARRDLRAARPGAERVRRRLSHLGWRYAEWLAQRVAWRSLFVSPLDRAAAAGPRPSDVIAIPVDEDLIAAGRTAPRIRRNTPRILIPTPVINPPQNRFDATVIAMTAEAFGDAAEIVVWGKGADAALAGSRPRGVRIAGWAEDYAGFLAGFDLVVYPRVIGGGFHTKLAEALVLGAPCLCADWVAAALTDAGYDGVTAFADEEDLRRKLQDMRDQLGADGLQRPTPPAKAHADAALTPLFRACEEAATW